MRCSGEQSPRKQAASAAPLRLKKPLLCAFYMLAALIGSLTAAPAFAQTVNTYVNGVDGAINAATTCAAPLVRNFNVGTSYIIQDVDLGVFITHTWRGDSRITLQSPSGTRVQLVDGEATTVSGDNVNVLLDDGGTQVVHTDTPTSNHSTANPPPFQHNFIPNSPFSAFAGEPSAGTWRMEICDIFPNADDGLFRHAELYLTEQNLNFADLSLSKNVSNASPTSGSNITFTLTLTNNASSPLTAANVTVNDLLPAGFVFVSYSGYGTYDTGTGNWQIASIAPGQSRAVSIIATVTATSGATVVNTAEVTSSPHPDLDSTPGNGLTGEDDWASASVTVSGARVAGTPPVLMCPAGTILFDWDTRSWTPGSINNNYTLTGLGSVGFALSNNVNYMNIGAFGGQSPLLTNVVTGGSSPSQNALFSAVDFVSISQAASAVMSLPVAVAGAQFTILDIDYFAGQFADRIKISGSLNGMPVTPVLTNGTSNFVIGNQAFGDALSGNTSSDGNVVVTFPSPIDTITIEYGNYSAGPSDPGGQAIAIHDILLCALDGELSVSKTSSIISDPINGSTNPIAIPGATFSYCILISNTGSAAATAIIASDTIPSDLTYVPGSMNSGTACGTAATSEDDNATGSDESDPVGASVSAATIAITASSLAAGADIALTFNAVVN